MKREAQEHDDVICQGSRADRAFKNDDARSDRQEDGAITEGDTGGGATIADQDQVGDEAMIDQCTLCEDGGWVCEDHPTSPWNAEHVENCIGASASCPWCNSPMDGTAPRMPEGFDEDRLRHWFRN